ncbi:MAG: pitrilysin family protein [Acidobacteriota bacterium]
MSPAAARRRGRRFRAAAILLPAALACALQAAGGSGPALPDDGGPWKNAPARFLLASGVPCIYQKDASSPTTVVGLVIGGGKAAVPAGLDGLATMSTRLLLEIPDEGKVQDLMAQATRLSFVCLEDCSIIVVECLSENLEAALRVTAKIVLDPLITGLRVGRAKELLEVNARAEEDDAVTAGRNAVFRGFFRDRGYGTPLYGTKASLALIDRKTVLSFVRRYLVKPNVFFCVQSDLDPEAVRRLLDGSFGSFPDGPASGLAVQDPALPEDRDIVLVKDARETYVGRAYALPRSGLDDMARGILLETLLGPGPGSRLWPLRLDERLAYSVDAELTWTRSAGILIARLETGRDKRARAVEALDLTLAGLRENGIAGEEMEAARMMARARFLRDTEAKSPRLRLLGIFAALGLGPEAAPGLLAAIQAVTREDLNAYARAVLDPARALRVTVGPASPAGPDAR